MKTTNYLFLLLTSVFLLTACGDDEGDIIVTPADKPSGTAAVNTNKNTSGPAEARYRLEFPQLKGGNSIVIVHRAIMNKNIVIAGMLSLAAMLSGAENLMKNPVSYVLVFNMEFIKQSAYICKLCVDFSCILSLFLIFSIWTSTCGLFRHQVEFFSRRFFPLILFYIAGLYFPLVSLVFLIIFFQ